MDSWLFGCLAVVFAILAIAVVPSTAFGDAGGSAYGAACPAQVLGSSTYNSDVGSCCADSCNGSTGCEKGAPPISNVFGRVMTLRHRWIVLAALALLRGNFPSHAEDFPLDEYEEHVNRYLAGTEGIAVDLTFEGCTTDGKTFTPSIDEFSFVSIPGYSRTKWKQDVNSKVATTQWLLRRPDGNFQIIQNGPKSFALEQSSQASSATSYRFTPFDVLTGPISGYRYALISELRGTTGDGHCHIVSFERHRGEGGTGSTLHLKDDLNEFEIDFNDQWLITRNKRVLLDTGWTGTYEMAYGNFEGRVVPLGSTSRFNDPALQEQWPTMHATFTNYRLFNGTAEDFSLKQFGIPDPGQATKPPAPSRWYLWFLLGGALSAGVAVFFWYRVKRRKARLA